MWTRWLNLLFCVQVLFCPALCAQCSDACSGKHACGVGVTADANGHASHPPHTCDTDHAPGHAARTESAVARQPHAPTAHSHGQFPGEHHDQKHGQHHGQDSGCEHACFCSAYLPSPSPSEIGSDAYVLTTEPLAAIRMDSGLSERRRNLPYLLVHIVCDQDYGRGLLCALGGLRI